MSLANQAKIVQVIQEQKFTRFGGNRVLDVNVRIIASTNKNLEKEIEEGRFREDLYFRLNVIPIVVPSLRERTSDVPILMAAFLKKWAEKTGSTMKTLALDTLDILAKETWPGNVRELKNLAERLAVTVSTDVITAADITATLNRNATTKAVLCPPFDTISTLKEALHEFERMFIREKVEAHENDREKAAKSLGISLSHLNKMIGG
jgi:two-component system nitrogen regulation response regulator NtrX